MKRMIREELIQKISELDVEELASAVAKAENSLQLPSEAPASAKLVSINTSGEQEEIDKELPAIATGDGGKALKVKSDESGVEWGAVSSGTKLYKHVISMYEKTTYKALTITLVNNVATPYTNKTALSYFDVCKNAISYSFNGNLVAGLTTSGYGLAYYEFLSNAFYSDSYGTADELFSVNDSVSAL